MTEEHKEAHKVNAVTALEHQEALVRGYVTSAQYAVGQMEQLWVDRDIAADPAVEAICEAYDWWREKLRHFAQRAHFHSGGVAALSTSSDIGIGPVWLGAVERVLHTDISVKEWPGVDLRAGYEQR